MKLSLASRPSLRGVFPSEAASSAEAQARADLLQQSYRDMLSDEQDGLVFRWVGGEMPSKTAMATRIAKRRAS